MPLRRSIVTPRALVARRLNSLKSTGPRTARGKAWSSLNALRHGQRCQRRTFRDKLARTGDSEALHLFDFIFEEILETSECRNERVWCRLRGLAVRAWCIESGRRGRKVAKTALRTKLESGVRIYRYAAKFVVPRRLKITNGLGWGFVLHNPVPSRRRRVGPAWIPEVEYIEGKLPKARRVRGGCKPGVEIFHSGAESREGRGLGNEPETRGRPEPKQSRWGGILRAVGGAGSSILQRLGGSARRGDPVPEPPCWDQEGPGVVDFGSSRGEPWDDPADYESESIEEFLLRHKFLARLALKAAEWASRKSSG